MLEWYASQLWLLVKITFCLFLIYTLVKAVFKDVKEEVRKKRETARHSKR